MTTFDLPMTIHANERFQERGFTKEIIEFLFHHGIDQYTGDNTFKFFITKKKLNEMLKKKEIKKDVKIFIRKNFEKLTKKCIFIVEGVVRTCINQYR